MEKVEWKVEGMTCSNCALTISKYLNKQGLSDVKVNVLDGDVSFETEDRISSEKIKTGIEGLGYTVITDQQSPVSRKHFLKKPIQKFWACLPFTLVLMLHMLPWHIHWLMTARLCAIIWRGNRCRKAIGRPINRRDW